MWLTGRKLEASDFTASLISHGAQSESGTFEASSAKGNQTAQSRTEGDFVSMVRNDTCDVDTSDWLPICTISITKCPSDFLFV